MAAEAGRSMDSRCSDARIGIKKLSVLPEPVPVATTTSFFALRNTSRASA
jgi:hypothetical protein